jgi:predicted transposase YbfD/YdcC
MSTSSTTNAGHGRKEARIVYALPATGWSWPEWRDVKSFVMIERVRQDANDTSTESSFFLSSLPPDAAVLADKIRKHWSIENQLHWVLDVAFGEDAQRVRDARGAQNFALLTRLALMLVRNETTKKKGAPTKRKRAGWDNNYLALVLTRGLEPAV